MPNNSGDMDWMLQQYREHGGMMAQMLFPTSWPKVFPNLVLDEPDGLGAKYVYWRTIIGLLGRVSRETTPLIYLRWQEVTH